MHPVQCPRTAADPRLQLRDPDRFTTRADLSPVMQCTKFWAKALGLGLPFGLSADFLEPLHGHYHFLDPCVPPLIKRHGWQVVCAS